MFHLRTKSRNLLQGDLIDTQYFNNLTKQWQDLDLFTPQNWSGPIDAALYHQILTREHIYDFLVSHDRSLDEIHGAAT